MALKDDLIAVLTDRRRQVGAQEFIDDVADLLLQDRASQRAILQPRVVAYRDSLSAASAAAADRQAEIDGLNALDSALGT